MTGEDRGVAVVAGAGPGNGQALARRFAAVGYRLALLARDGNKVSSLAEGIDGARGYACDVGDPAAVAETFGRIRRDLGEVSALLFNAGSGVFADVETITAEQFEAAWRVNALGGFLCAREVIPAMVRRGKGNIIFVGATASRRGARMTAAFAPAKAAQRSLAEAMAKSLWPKGVHVALIVLDGVVDTPAARERMPDRAPDAFVTPDALADAAWMLSEQDRHGWSFEVEARPWSEPW